MADVQYIGADQDGPLIKVCQQVLEWHDEPKLVVVIWHEEWQQNPKYWSELAKVMHEAQKAVGKVTKTLITFFGSSIDAYFDEEGGDRLPLLFRLLGRDTESRNGCCRITDFRRLGDAPISFDPNAPETALILRSNRIMGLCHDEQQEVQRTD